MGVPRVSRRWLVPVVAAGLIAGGGLLGPVVADASPDLPDVTPEQLLTKVQTAKVDGLSGTVRTSVDLGLPPPPGLTGGGEHQGSLITGDHTLRVAYAAPDKARVAVLDDMSERVWVTDGKTGWSYNSRTHEATRVAIPPHSQKAPKSRPDPGSIARQFLDAVDPSTKVDVTGTESVAGRDAYKLRLTPRTDRTLVGSVTLAVDAKTWVPLRVTVMPRAGGEPAIEVGFTDVSFRTPAASTFAFTPPKGTDVKDGEFAPDLDFFSWSPPNKSGKPSRTSPPNIIGSGWDAVLVTKWSSDPMLDQVLAGARQVAGGRVLTSRLVNALFLDDGRLLVGMVPVGVLESAAR